MGGVKYCCLWAIGCVEVGGLVAGCVWVVCWVGAVVLLCAFVGVIIESDMGYLLSVMRVGRGLVGVWGFTIVCVGFVRGAPTFRVLVFSISLGRHSLLVFSRAMLFGVILFVGGHVAPPICFLHMVWVLGLLVVCRSSVGWPACCCIRPMRFS